MRRLVVALAAVAGLLVPIASSVSSASAADGVSTVCRFTDDRFIEISGMTYSQLHPGVIWLHNDSGGGPFVYAVDAATCRTLATITIRGIEARDIEAIASGRDVRGRPVLWVGDIGDNRDSWPQVRLHLLREPAILADGSVRARTYLFTYADRPHDAEALLADPDSLRLWVVTKQLAQGRLHELPARMSRTGVNVARPVRGEVGLVTDGSVSPDGSRYVLRDYFAAQLFAGLPPGRPTQVVALPLQRQGEAVTWAPDGSALLVASEGDDRLLRVEVPTAGTERAASVVPAPVATAIAAPASAAVPAEPSSPDPFLLAVAATAFATLGLLAGGAAIARRRGRAEPRR